MFVRINCAIISFKFILFENADLDKETHSIDLNCVSMFYYAHCFAEFHYLYYCSEARTRYLSTYTGNLADFGISVIHFGVVVPIFIL